MLCLNESLWSKCWLRSAIGYGKIKPSVFTAVPYKPHFCLPSGAQSPLRLTGHFCYRLNDWINPVLHSWYLWLRGNLLPLHQLSMPPVTRSDSLHAQFNIRIDLMWCSRESGILSFFIPCILLLVRTRRWHYTKTATPFDSLDWKDLDVLRQRK